MRGFSLVVLHSSGDVWLDGWIHHTGPGCWNAGCGWSGEDILGRLKDERLIRKYNLNKKL